MNLYDNILWKVTNQNVITHILSYDLKSPSGNTYSELSEKLRKEFSWKKTQLQSQTLWELSTSAECNIIMQTIIAICWTNCEINLYKVQVLEKKIHPAISQSKKLLAK